MSSSTGKLVLAIICPALGWLTKNLLDRCASNKECNERMTAVFDAIILQVSSCTTSKSNFFPCLGYAFASLLITFLVGYCCWWSWKNCCSNNETSNRTINDTSTSNKNSNNTSNETSNKNSDNDTSTSNKNSNNTSNETSNKNSGNDTSTSNKNSNSTSNETSNKSNNDTNTNRDSKPIVIIPPTPLRPNVKGNISENSTPTSTPRAFRVDLKTALNRGVVSEAEAVELWLELRTFDRIPSLNDSEKDLSLRSFSSVEKIDLKTTKSAFVKMFQHEVGDRTFDQWWYNHWNRKNFATETQPTAPQDLWEAAYNRLEKKKTNVKGNDLLVPEIPQRVMKVFLDAVGFDEQEIKALFVVCGIPDDLSTSFSYRSSKKPRSNFCSPRMCTWSCPTISFDKFCKVWLWVGDEERVGQCIKKLFDDFVPRDVSTYKKGKFFSEFQYSFKPFFDHKLSKHWLMMDLNDQTNVPIPFIPGEFGKNREHVYHDTAKGRKAYVVRWSGINGSFSIQIQRRLNDVASDSNATPIQEVAAFDVKATQGAESPRHRFSLSTHNNNMNDVSKTVRLQKFGTSNDARYVLQGLEEAVQEFVLAGDKVNADAKLVKKSYKDARIAIGDALKCLSFNENEYCL
jgi:hypothetical protein